MAKAKSNLVRYRISVPADDKAVIAWLEQQRSPSQSIRVAIKEILPRHGFGDLFSSEVPSDVAFDWGGVEHEADVEAAKETPEAKPLTSRVSRQPKVKVAGAAPKPEEKPGAGIQMGADIMSDFSIGTSIASKEDVSDMKKMMGGV